MGTSKDGAAASLFERTGNSIGHLIAKVRVIPSNRVFGHWAVILGAFIESQRSRLKHKTHAQSLAAPKVDAADHRQF